MVDSMIGFLDGHLDGWMNACSEEMMTALVGVCLNVCWDGVCNGH